MKDMEVPSNSISLAVRVMPEEKSLSAIILDRGMAKDECKAICTSSMIPLREKLFFRMIHETTTRPIEVLEARIELWNRNTGEITLTCLTKPRLMPQ